ncbi:hypothetical protein [Sphingomonas agri]|uniref:hypothetical protein n=1 Tax=Sphingomonas agri TaxID=1813878 RepID=UPI00311E2BF7
MGIHRAIAALLLCLITAPTLAATHMLSAAGSHPPVTYDTSIGNGVDINGFASLPLRSGAHRYFVKTGTGSNTNNCTAAQSPSTPKATIGSAFTCVTSGNGDQVLVAEGGTYSEPIPNFTSKSGFSAVYPTVLETYDPADPTNEAKYGRGDQRGARPVVTGGGIIGNSGAGPGQINYIVIKGFNHNPGNVGGFFLTFTPNGVDGATYVLLENNIFTYTGFTADESSATAGTPNHFIIRNNAIYGAWDGSTDKGGINFLDGWSNVTIEDNVFWHNGWKVGASRDDAYAAGGTTIFKHQAYVQSTNPGPVIFRRNLDIDGAADGGQFRTNTTISENVFIDNPLSVAAGGGSNYDTYQPSGVDLEVAYNAIVGDADINTANPTGIAIEMSNGRVGSSAHHNLIIRSRNPASSGILAFNTVADHNQPSYADWNANTVYLWSTSGATHSSGSGAVPSQDFPFYTNNVWDDPAAGSNATNSGVTFPYAYTAAQLYTALGYADKTTFINYVIAHPEAHVQRLARAQLFAGYAVNTRAPRTLGLAKSSFVIGTSSSSRILGALSGSNFTASGQPASLTVSGTNIAFDGTGTTTSGSFTLTEAPTLGRNSRATTIAYSIGPAPATLNPSDTSGANIALSNGNLTATTSASGIQGVRSNHSVSSGKYYWEVHRDVFADSNIPGVADSSASFTASYWALTANAHAAGWFGTTLRYNTTTQTTASPAGMLGFALDATAKKLWVRDSTGWLNGDPVAGTGGLDITGIGTPIYAGWQGDTGDKATYNFGQTMFTYTPPTGYGNMLIPLLFLPSRRRRRRAARAVSGRSILA